MGVSEDRETPFSDAGKSGNKIGRCPGFLGIMLAFILFTVPDLGAPWTCNASQEAGVLS